MAIARLLLAVAIAAVAALPSQSPPQPLRRAASPDDRVALSFDLTWGDAELRRILSILDARGVHATFFAGGSWVVGHPQQLQRLVAAGHEVGTLGQLIVAVDTLPPAQLTAQLIHAQNVMEQVLGRPVRHFRPPLGEPAPAVLSAAQAAGLRTVTYSLDGRDHQLAGAKLIRHVVRGARRGDIVRLTASDFAPATAAALPGIIDGLRGRGFKLVTLSDLLPERP